VLNEQDSFGQQENKEDDDEIEDEIEERDDSDEDDDDDIFDHATGATGEEEEILLDSLARPGNDDIEVSTGTFGKVREQINNLNSQIS